MKTHISIILTILISFQLFGQPKSHIKHYGLEDGLPQRSIMNIMQDRKGFIWLATWDGLCKFDGYNFTSYKTFTEDPIMMKNSRIDRLAEDVYGYIWLRTYNRESFRFDPRTEKYIATFRTNNESFKTSEIITMPSGKVWLTSDAMGTICVLDSLNIHESFSLQNKNLPSNKVYTIYEDSSRFSWILTDNGLARLSPSRGKEEDGRTFFAKNNSYNVGTPFFTAFETKTEIWFGANNGQIWHYSKDNEIFKRFDTGVQSNIISIKKVRENLYIILTSKDGFIICDKNRTNLRRFNKNNLKELPTNEMLSCFIDSKSNVWLETNSKGIAKFNLVDSKLSYYVPGDYDNNTILSPPFFIIEDKEEHIWVQPHGGFSFYDKKSDKLIPFFNNPLSPEWKFSDMLHHAFLDKQRNMWLSTRAGGLEKIVFDNTLFKLNDFYSNKTSITGPEVRSILEDANNNIWLGNMNGIISVYDPNRDFKGYLCQNGTISKSGVPLKEMAYSLLQDKDGSIWIGTKGNGIYLLNPKDKTYTSFDIEQYKNDPNNAFSLSNNAVYSIHEDENKQIWIGTYGGGINMFDRENERFINHNNNFNNYPIATGAQIRTVQSHNNNIYVGTTLGLIVFSLDEDNTSISNYKIYSKSSKTEDGIRANDIYNIHVTKNNDVYIATFGGGMSKVTVWDEQSFPSTFKMYDRKNGLHSDIVLTIVDDNDNNLWINGEGSLSKFNPNTELFEQYNDVSRAIGNQYFMETLPILTSGGELIYGCTHGTLSFNPNQISENTFIPYLALTKFKVSNNDYPLQIKIDDIEEITLNHNENIFSIEYAALDYTDPQSISYEYKLEGFNDEWVSDQKQRIANYTNIPAGEYVFKVRSTNSNGTWVDNEHRLSITITPSFWQTKWAYLIYVISFIILLYTILRAIFVFYRMKDRVLLKQEETEMKTHLFTNITHEIRTPLTMIISPIENILENNKTHSEIRPQLLLVLNNTNRLLKMINSKDENILLENNFDLRNDFCNQILEISHKTDESLTNSQLSILVVEDNLELRSFIRSVLENHYQIYEAKDGKEGYDEAVKNMPDFILSDIMMPEMNGIEFLQKIKENQDTSHIPFIFLTAKTNIDDELEGISLGANDYITKPFNVKLLIAKIDNIIKQRKLYVDYLSEENSVESHGDEFVALVEQNKITELDDLFVRKLREETYNSLDNSDFKIDDLVSSTNLSRRVFFNKVKSLTGLAPVEFVREIRIKHAAQLIKTQQYRIKEVAYMVGFSDIRYFTQRFKDMFGMTPSEYRDHFKDRDI